MAEDAPQTDEEFARRLEEELKRIKISDLLVQTIYTVSSLGYKRLEEEGRDLEQARLAIEAVRALAPVLAGAVPDELTSEFNQLVANLQLAYADAAAVPKPSEEGSSQ